MKNEKKSLKLGDSKKRKINPYYYDFVKMVELTKLLANNRTNKSFNLLLSLLNARTAFIRSATAITLRHLKDNRAVTPLMDAIKVSRNKKNRGTLVYALEYLNCSDLFLPMVELALSNEYEVQAHALNILREQTFKTNRQEIAVAEEMIKKYLKADKKCEDYKLLIKELTRYLNKIEKKVSK